MLTAETVRSSAEGFETGYSPDVAPSPSPLQVTPETFNIPTTPLNMVDAARRDVAEHARPGRPAPEVAEPSSEAERIMGAIARATYLGVMRRNIAGLS